MLTKHDDFFIPRLESPYILLLLLISFQLLAILITLANPEHLSWVDLSYNSLFIHWNVILSVVVICIIRPLLIHLNTIIISLILLVILPAITFGITAFSHIFLDIEFKQSTYLRFTLISFIASAVVLRGFYLNHQYNQLKQAELKSRIESLQARIRPHFLFNSLNSIISLLNIDVKKAEQAILDLSDLFRASLSTTDTLISFQQELNLAKSYVAIEQSRFANKLQIIWHCDEVPDNLPIAELTLQPLIENAVIHGVQNSTTNQLIMVNASFKQQIFTLKISNSYTKNTNKFYGTHHALTNIEMRIKAIFGDKASLQLKQENNQFVVTLKYPVK